MQVNVIALLCRSISFFFNDTATTEIYTLSLHDALPISSSKSVAFGRGLDRDALLEQTRRRLPPALRSGAWFERSEEHTSELQSRLHIVCRLLLEKKKRTSSTNTMIKTLSRQQSHTPHHV